MRPIVVGGNWGGLGEGGREMGGEAGGEGACSAARNAPSQKVGLCFVGSRETYMVLPVFSGIYSAHPCFCVMSCSEEASCAP